jgi:hypothetical protein
LEGFLPLTELGSSPQDLLIRQIVAPAQVEQAQPEKPVNAIEAALAAYERSKHA